MKKRLGALLLAASMVVSTVALGGCSSGKPAETKAATEAAAPAGGVSYTHLDVYKRQAYIWTGELDELLPEFQETPGTVLQ